MSAEEKDRINFVLKLEEDINALKAMREESKGKWLIASEHHLFVGEGNGINQTGFTVRSVMQSHYPMFNTIDEAQKHIDPYLIDGGGSPIINKPIEAEKFFTEEIDTLESCREFLVKSIKNKSDSEDLHCL